MIGGGKGSVAGTEGESYLRILIVDDHPLMRAGISYTIRRNYSECDILEAGSEEEGFALALSKSPDLILLDLRIPRFVGGNKSSSYGLDMLDSLRNAAITPSVMILSDDVTRETAALGRHYSAITVVPKNTSPERLYTAIQDALRNAAPATQAITANRQGEPAATTSITPADLGITSRMFDVLRLALQGHAAWKIALILDINATNVRRYLSRLYEKFGVINLNGLQAHFVRSGQVAYITSTEISGHPSQMRT